MSKRKKRRKHKTFLKSSFPTEKKSAESQSVSSENIQQNIQPTLPLHSENEPGIEKNEKITIEQKSETVFDSSFNVDNSPTLNYRKIIKVSLITIASLLVAWILLPPLIANTPLVTEPIEENLANKFDANVDVQKVEISNWTLSPKIKIYSIDFYEKNTNVFLAYVDNVRFQLNPFYLLTGKFKTKKIKIGRIDVELPSLIVQRYLLKHKYISKPIITEPLNNVEQYMSFVNSSVLFSYSNDYEIVNVKSDCEIPFMRETSIVFTYMRQLNKKNIIIKKFHAGGVRSIQKLNFEKGKANILTLDLPIDIDLTGKIYDKTIDIKPIKLSLDTCIINGYYLKNTTGTFVNLNAVDQNLDRIERLFKTRTVNNKLIDVSFNINASALEGSKMITDCNVKVKNGIFRNVPFENFSMSFNLINDVILSFDSSVNVWNGSLLLNLLNKTAATGTNFLTGRLSAAQADLNACLSELSSIPAKAGGEFNFDINFEVENTGIAEFINNKLAQLAFTRGTGEICLSNAYLKYFSSERWQETKEIPKIVRSFLQLAANMTGAPLSLPIIKKLIKHLEVNKPRTVFAKLFIDNGNLTAPEIQAEIPVGTLLASGTCSKSGELNYQVQIYLNDDVIKKYGNHPLLSMFLTNNVIKLPVSLTGTLESPNVQLNLTPEQKKMFEERLTKVVTEYVKEKLMNKQQQAEITEDNMNFIKKTVKSLIKRFL